ncbi:MAG TPA: thioredoxin domain-containing protein [Solirubrobacterales bacterium]|nr:thioredoxin domain-containing protein [Solirubrobacterales bacterium]
MEGRDQERERLRAERQAAESQDAAKLARKRRVQYLSLAAFAAVAVVVALIVISQSGGSSDKTTPTNVANVKGVAEVNTELQGLSQSGQTLGDSSAPVTVTEFGDPQCPVCKAFSEQVAPDLISSDVKTGKVKYTYQPYLIIGPDSKPAMKAALAAGEQGRFWNYLQLFYLNQGEENSGYVTDTFLTSIAKAAGVSDIDKWNTSRNSTQWDSIISNGTTSAEGFGFNGTPSLVAQGPNGTKAVNGFSLSEIQAAIQQVS